MSRVTHHKSVHHRRAAGYTLILAVICGEVGCLWYLAYFQHDWAASFLIVAGWVKHKAARFFEEMI